MENKFFKVNHQGPGWNHFKARDLHRKNLNLIKMKLVSIKIKKIIHHFHG